MARYTKVLNSLAHNAVGNRRIQALEVSGSILPSQTGNAGKFLKTDGSTTSWATSSSANNFVDSVSVNIGTGIITLGRDGLSDLTSLTLSPLTTKGDLWVFGSANTRLPVGTNGYALVADSSTATGLNWAANSDGNYVTTAATMGTNGILTGTVGGGGSNWVSNAFNVVTNGQIAYGQSTSGLTTGSANLTYDGTNLSLAPDTDVTATIGNAVVGYNFSDYASFSHYDQRANTGGYALLQSDVGLTFLNAAASKSIRFRINNADKMTMDANGKLGIGTTSPPNALTVHKAIANDFVTELKNTHATAGQSWGLQVCAGTNSSDAALAVENEAEDTSLFYVRGDGNVGIGTTNPIQPLHVLTSANDKGILIDVSDNTHEGRLIFGDVASNGVGHIGYNHSMETMRFTVGGFETVRMAADANYKKLFLGADSTLGFYRYGNRMDFYISSNPRMHLDAGKLYSASTGGPLLDLTPTTNEANYGFVDDPDTGMSRTAANELSLMTAGTNAITIDSSQQVGIGETTPIRKLDVNSGTGSDIVARFRATNNRASIKFSR